MSCTMISGTESRRSMIVRIYSVMDAFLSLELECGSTGWHGHRCMSELGFESMSYGWGGASTSESLLVAVMEASTSICSSSLAYDSLALSTRLSRCSAGVGVELRLGLAGSSESSIPSLPSGLFAKRGEKPRGDFQSRE